MEKTTASLNDMRGYFGGVIQEKSGAIGEGRMDEDSLNAMQILVLIEDVISKPDDAEKHRALHRFIISKKMTCSSIVAYLDNNNDDFMYVEEQNGRRKVWKNDAGQYHRTTKDENGLTKPARIDSDGDQYWYIDGVMHREDRDKFGHMLPSWVRSDGSKYWLKNGRSHRAELGDDPSDVANFGKALPSDYRPGRRNWWFYRGNEINQDDLTKILLKKKAKKDMQAIENCKNMKKITITTADGNVVSLNGPFDSVAIERSNLC